jgi:hypothetical protein
MPFAYDNTQSPFYSETAHDLGFDQNWREHGADALRLFIRGQEDNDPGSLYIVVEDTAKRDIVATHPDPAVLATAEWQEWVIPLSAFDGVALSAVQKVYLGVGDRDNPTPGGAGLIFVDDLEFGHPIGGPPQDRR